MPHVLECTCGALPRWTDILVCMEGLKSIHQRILANCSMPKPGNFEVPETCSLPTQRIEHTINFSPLEWKASTCATPGTLANGQISCPNMEILNIGLDHGNPCAKIKLYLSNCCNHR